MAVLGPSAQHAESPCNLVPMAATKWITRKAAADTLGVSVTHFHRLVRAHTIRKRIKASGEMSSVRYAADDVKALKRERESWV